MGGNRADPEESEPWPRSKALTDIFIPMKHSFLYVIHKLIGYVQSEYDNTNCVASKLNYRK